MRPNALRDRVLRQALGYQIWSNCLRPFNRNEPTNGGHEPARTNGAVRYRTPTNDDKCQPAIAHSRTAIFPRCFSVRH